MIKTVHGWVHGKTIELDDDLAVALGQEVEVQVKLVPSGQQCGAGIRRAAGLWTDYPQMAVITRSTKNGRKLE